MLRRTASELISSDILFLSLVGQVEQINFDKGYRSFIMADSDDSSNSDDNSNETEEYFYSPDDSKASDSISVKSCVHSEWEGMNIFIYYRHLNSCNYLCQIEE